MKMTFRWYGSAADPIPLKYVKQIPGMTGLMGLLDKPAGVLWEEAEIKALVDEVHAGGLELEVIESVNIHEDIKTGLPARDKYIENYIATIRNLAKHGVKVIIYNFMPVFDWLRTDLARVIPEDGSNSLYFDEKDLGTMGPLEIVKKTAEGSQGFSLPGWEPERLALLEQTLKQYEGMTPDTLRKNYKYFLDAVIPVCEDRRSHGLPPGRPRVAHLWSAAHRPQPGGLRQDRRPARFPGQHRVPLHGVPGLQPGERHPLHHPALREDGSHRRNARA